MIEFKVEVIISIKPKNTILNIYNVDCISKLIIDKKDYNPKTFTELKTLEVISIKERHYAIVDGKKVIAYSKEELYKKVKAFSSLKKDYIYKM